MKPESVAALAITSCMLCLLTGCGDGGGGSTVTQNVVGVASIGAPINGNAALKDGTGLETSGAINGTTGAFTLSPGDRQPPYIVRADSLYSLSGAGGRANINPFSNLLVAEAGGFTTMANLDQFYGSPDQGRLQNIFGSLSTARRVFHQKLDPLLAVYGLTARDPISDPLVLNQGYGQLFNDVRVNIDANGAVTMTNRNNLPVFTSQLGNLAGGTLVTTNILPPSAVGTGGTVIGPTTTTTGTGTTTTGVGTTTTTGTGTTTTTGTGTIITGPTTGTTTIIGPSTGTTTGTGTGTTTGTATGTTTIGPATTGTITITTPTTTTITGTGAGTTTIGGSTTGTGTITGTGITPTITGANGTATITTTGTTIPTTGITVAGPGTGTSAPGTGTTGAGTGSTTPGTGTAGTGTITTTGVTGTL